jgi:hypothetical protein
LLTSVVEPVETQSVDGKEGAPRRTVGSWSGINPRSTATRYGVDRKQHVLAINPTSRAEGRGDPPRTTGLQAPLSVDHTYQQNVG